MKSILVANLAGGVGKSTSVHSLATAMAEYGKNVAVIDADPGSFLTFLCGIENPRYSTNEFFSGTTDIEVVSVRSSDRFSIIPGASRLANWEPVTLKPLREVLAIFDLVLIDTPSGVSKLLPALFELADLILAPVMRDLHSIRGLLNLRDFNLAEGEPALIEVLDIARGDWPEELRELVSAEFKIIEPAVTYEAALPDSQASGTSLLTKFPRAQSSSDFREVAYLLLENFDLI